MSEAMTAEERARVVMKQAQLAAQLGPAELAEAQQELIARAITEAVQAERRACAEIARGIRLTATHVDALPLATRTESEWRMVGDAIASAIEARRD